MSLIVELPVCENEGPYVNVPMGNLNSFDSCLMSSERKQIIPVACMGPKGFTRFYHSGFTAIKELLLDSKRWSKIFAPDFPIGIRAAILRAISQYRIPEDRRKKDGGYYYKHDISCVPVDEQKEVIDSIISETKEKLALYATGSPLYSMFDNQAGIHGYYWRYQSLIDHFWHGSGFRIMRTRNPRMKFVVGRYYLAHYNNLTGATIPLVCLVTQAKFMDLIRWSHLLGKPVDSKHFQLWVKDDFDVVRSTYSLIRPRYRKFIKKPMEEAGVRVITKPDLKILFSKFQGVKCDTMKEYHEFLKDSSKEILFELRRREGLLLSEETEEIIST